jgi:hypothetical protein
MSERERSVPRPLRVQRPAQRIPAARRATAATSKARSRDFHRALIVLASLAVLAAGILVGGYGVHVQITAANERVLRHHWQLAAATRAELRDGTILFVPIGGNVCRRRLIENATWAVRDGGEVECDDEVAWNSTLPETRYQIGLRMDAVSRTFRK